MDRMQLIYEEADDIKGNFIQESFLKSLNKWDKMEGEFYIKKPGMMRWNYKKPYIQEIIIYGRKIWIYYPLEKEVTVNKLSDALIDNISITFLLGAGNIKKDFNIKMAKVPYSFNLFPKNQMGDVDRIFINIDSKSYLIKLMEIHDIYGNINRLKFNNLSINNNISLSLFIFKPPKDVEIIGEE